MGFGFQFTLLAVAKIAGHKASGFVQTVEFDIQSPVFLALECADLIFTIHHQTGSNTLDTAGRQTAAHLLPQQGRKLIANDTVQNSSGLLGIHQIIVDLTGLTDGLGDRFLGDGIEGDPVGLFLGQLQKLGQMPCDGLALTVRVRCQIYRFGRTGSSTQFIDQFFFSGYGNIFRRKIMLQIHTHGAFGQVTQMTHTGLDHIVIAQVFSNGFCLGGGFYNHKIGFFCHGSTPFLGSNSFFQRYTLAGKPGHNTLDLQHGQ